MLAWNLFQLVKLNPQVLTIGMTTLYVRVHSTDGRVFFWFCSLALLLIFKKSALIFEDPRMGRGGKGPGAGGLEVGPFLTILPTTDPPSLISYTFLQLYLFSTMPSDVGFCRFNPEGLQQGKHILHCAFCACVWKAHPFGDPSSSLSVHTFRP